MCEIQMDEFLIYVQIKTKFGIKSAKKSYYENWKLLLKKYK